MAASWAWAPDSLTPVLPVRSAEPGNSPGTESAMALRQVALATRVAIWSPTVKVGSWAAQPSRPVPAWPASKAARSPVQAS